MENGNQAIDTQDQETALRVCVRLIMPGKKAAESENSKQKQAGSNVFCVGSSKSGFHDGLRDHLSLHGASTMSQPPAIKHLQVSLLSPSLSSIFALLGLCLNIFTVSIKSVDSDTTRPPPPPHALSTV